MTWAARHYQARREWQATRKLAEEIITLATEQGLAQWLAWGTMLPGWTMAEQGQPREGIGQLRSGLEAMQSTGTQMFHPYYLCLLAEAYGKAGQPSEGLAKLAEALALSAAKEEYFWEAELYRLRGELLLLEGVDAVEVEACFEQASEIARRQQAKSLELRAVLSLARLWRQQNRIAEAQQRLAEIYSWFSEGSDTADLREAKALLAELENR